MATSNAAAAPVADAVYSFKLLEALRKGDHATIAPLLPASKTDSFAKESCSPLHLAVRCADFNVITYLIQTKSIDLNAVESQHGNTALHLASASGREDVVQLLLDQEVIDDSKRNIEGKDALDVAKTPEVAQQIQLSRAYINHKYLEALAAYEQSPQEDSKMYGLLDLPRSSVIDLNAHSDSGSTLLHEAVKRKDTRMIEAAARKGADIYARDRRGKRVSDINKDEKVKVLLRQLQNADATHTSLSQTGQPPAFKGYLSKWTSYAHGYKTRWFVLDNGILSYYQYQDDEGKQSRGAYNMRFAKINADPSDKHKIEIVTETTKGSNKLYLRSTHPVERARWVQVLQQTKSFFEMERTSSRPESMYRHRAPSTSSVHSMQAMSSTTGSLANPMGIVRPTSTAPSEKANRGLLAARSITRPSSRAGSEKSMPMINRSPSLLSRLSSDEREDDGEGEASGGGMPFEVEFPLIAESLRTQAELSQKLVGAFTASNAEPASSSASDHQSSLASSDSIRAALEAAVKDNLLLVERYQSMSQAREKHMQRKYERELQIKHLWEENMKVLSQQHTEMETQLREAATENAARRKALRDMRESMGYSPGGVMTPPPMAASGSMASMALKRDTMLKTSTTDDSDSQTIAARRLGEDKSADLQLNDAEDIPRRPSMYTLADDQYGVRDSADDAEDEFFDAIESGNLPGLKVEAPLTKPSTSPDQWPEKFDKNMSDDITDKIMQPYMHLRSSMPIGKDDRPSVSLWAILKNNIGKDLTKISFPVSFNEPTSMLQRMAEDMEFSECLDAAALQEDSTKRIAFVAAFAMSNYSSTIGRIAKPFNPLLGETFEYMRPDKKYRYISEQVSHHPPVSACFAQAPMWEYMGCVDAKSKFLGRTFEIRPTGVAHVNLKVPSKWVQSDKELTPAKFVGDDHVMEHYSWNKVTTSVSGFIVGSPTIDHYGDMEVTNHATGDKCVLTFKPRGWRGKDAFEIRGSVYNAKGRKVWDIAGRWNSQLVARLCGAGSGDLNPDQSVDAPDDTIATAQPMAEYMLLWRNSKKPPSPFNLTPFAITLNSCPDDLKPWLAPTDCRLRPDLSAFEIGKFDQANDLKQKLENHQRETRKKREAGELAAHKPRWFSRITDPDTNESLWQPQSTTSGGGLNPQDTTSYWVERHAVGSKKVKGEHVDWPDVYHVFGDFEVQ